MDEKLVLEVLSFLLEKETFTGVAKKACALLTKVQAEIVDMKQREDFEESH